MPIPSENLSLANLENAPYARMQDLTYLDAKPSDLCFVNDSIIIADDGAGLLEVNDEFDVGYKAKPSLNRKFKDLEGLCYDKKNELLWVLDEYNRDGGSTLYKADFSKPNKDLRFDSVETFHVPLSASAAEIAEMKDSDDGYEGVSVMNVEGQSFVILCQQLGDKKLNVFDPESGRIVQSIDVPGLTDVEDVKFRELCCSPDGTMMVLTSGPSAVSKVSLTLNPSTGFLQGELTEITRLDKLKGMKIESVAYDGDDNLWVADDNRGIMYRIVE